MKHLIKSAYKNPLISGSAIIFFGSNFANVFNLLFNFFMVRNLSDAGFGVLSNLNSILILPLLIATGLSPIVVNFAAGYFSQGRIDLVHGFYNKIAVYYISGCAIFLIVYLLCTPFLSVFFHIPNIGLVALTGVIAFVGLVATLNNSFLQAKLAFVFIAISTLISALLRVLFGILFVFLGFHEASGIWSIFISNVVLLLLTLIPLRFIFKKSITPSQVPTKDLVAYGIPAGIAILGFTLFISTDIFFVKHFFSPAQAGIYASIELVGKIVYFLTSSISTVMFPIIVQKNANGESYHKTFLLACGLVLLPSIVLTLLYYVFPQFILTVIVKKSSVVDQSYLLGLFGLLMTIYSLVGLFTYFYLSIKKTSVAYFILITALIQAILIWFYHSSFQNVIFSTLSTLLLLLVGLILYYPHATKK